MISRRSFFIFSAALAVMPITYRIANQAKLKEQYISDVIGRRLSYLDIDQSEIQKFSALFVTHNPAMNEWRGQVVAYLGDGISSKMSRLVVTASTSRLKNFEERIASDFLLSSNFFTTSREGEHEIKFVTLNHPYLSPCWNPLRRLV